MPITAGQTFTSGSLKGKKVAEPSGAAAEFPFIGYHSDTESTSAAADSVAELKTIITNALSAAGLTEGYSPDCVKFFHTPTPASGDEPIYLNFLGGGHDLTIYVGVLKELEPLELEPEI